MIKQFGEKPRNILNRSFTNQILKDLKQNNSFLYNSESSSLQASAENYIQSMKNFLKGNANFPKFKAKRHSTLSFKVKNNNNNIRIENNKIRIAKHGFCKAKGLRNIKGKISHIVITLVGNKWFASINYKKVKIEPLAKTNKKVGVDVGIINLATLSTGEKITKLNSSKKEEKIAKLQKKLSRQKYGSKRWQKTKNKLQTEHLKIKNARNDYLHKLSWKLVNDFDLIKIENLKISNMLKNHNLAKSISHASWYEFRRQLKYKCTWYQKELVIVPPHNTSKKCNVCGQINKKLTLKDRSWKCPNCHTIHDRDVNAAINILNRRDDGDSSIN
jgi:putative transposase